jgi:hypothetical protein
MKNAKAFTINDHIRAWGKKFGSCNTNTDTKSLVCRWQDIPIGVKWEWASRVLDGESLNKVEAEIRRVLYPCCQITYIPRGDSYPSVVDVREISDHVHHDCDNGESMTVSTMTGHVVTVYTKDESGEVYEHSSTGKIPLSLSVDIVSAGES